MVGVELGQPRRPAVEVLPAGSTLLMYTDGLVERRGSDLDTGLELVRATAERLGVDSPHALCHRLIEAVRRGGSSDDVAVVAMTLD
jgi:serine phosphatase RsbU (regulator of sigma subunit)